MTPNRPKSRIPAFVRGLRPGWLRTYLISVFKPQSYYRCPPW